MHVKVLHKILHKNDYVEKVWPAKGWLGSLTNNFCPANCEKNQFKRASKWLQNITYLL